jgi:signal transduction histidine kinase/ActR/RegA family two-component response regulator
MFGYELNELKFRNFGLLRIKELSDEEDQEGVRQLLKNKFWSAEVKLKRKDESTFIGYVSIGWIRKFKKEYLVYRIKDITREKEFEHQLILAKDRAEEVAQAKARFLATMSHEIRTPMNGVIGMTNLLSRTHLDNWQKSYVDTIQKSGENLLVIINDILDYSKIESGKIELDKHLFNLRELLLDIIDLLGPSAEDKGLDLVVKIGPNIPDLIVADSTRIKQILVNLVNNAIKFTKNGNIHLIIEKLSLNGDDLRIEFKVKDSGIGIPREKLSTLFDSFTQVDSSTTRKYGGTGLGLAICKNLVELMGGHIFAISKEGEGSEFCFDVLCSADIESADPKLLDEKQLDHSLEKFDLGQLKVLVAEDNFVNQQVASMLLQTLGISCKVVANGKQSLEAFDTEHFDLVLMDLQMPEMDGITATELLLKRFYAKKNKPGIVALTANAMVEERNRCAEAGMIGFIAKPIMIPELKAVILNYLEAQRLHLKARV